MGGCFAPRVNDYAFSPYFPAYNLLLLFLLPLQKVKRGMKVLRSIQVLSLLMGLEAPLEELASLVREDMRRTLTAEERQDYHGITRLGYPHKIFSKLFNVSTTEDLVIAEETGAYHAPVDFPGQVYLFAAGKGVVALVAPKMTLQLLAMSGRPPATKELDVLAEEYKSLDVGKKDWEADLQEIATHYVLWACE